MMAHENNRLQSNWHCDNRNCTSGTGSTIKTPKLSSRGASFETILTVLIAARPEKESGKAK